MSHILTIETSQQVEHTFSLPRVISAEILKTRRTLAFWLTLIAPLAIALLQLLLFLERGSQLVSDEASPWLVLTRQNLTFWALLMQPLFITLETALVAQLDHSGDHWKHLFALPVPRWTIYIGKLIVNLYLIGLSMAVLFGYTLTSGFLLRAARPDYHFETAIPLLEMLKLFMMGYLSAWLTIALHHWVSLRWRSFVVACAFGIVMTISGVMLINTNIGGFYPWTSSAVIINSIRLGKPYLAYLLYSCLGGVLVSALGALNFLRKEAV